MYSLWFAAGVFVLCWILRFTILQKKPSGTGSGAIVMGMGIFLYGAMEKIPWLTHFGKIFAAVLFATWLFIFASFVADVFHGTFKKRHLDDPVGIFGIGTWVAATSVLGNVLSIYFMEWMVFLRILAVLNAFLWLFYLFLFLRSYHAVFRTEAQHRVHGVVLLSAVSTQSIVIYFHNVLTGVIPISIMTVLIYAGMAFYITGFYAIFRRFRHVHNWWLRDDWLPSNCIIHGAMSIMGVGVGLVYRGGGH